MNPLTSPATDSSTGPEVGIDLKVDLQICAPGNVKAWRTSATTALLSWDEPYATCNLCPDVIGYEVLVEGLSPLNVARPPCEVKGLKANSEYITQVIAKAAGNIRSRRSYALIGASPGMPVKLNVRRVTHTSALLTWSPPVTPVPVFDYMICSEEQPIGSTKEHKYMVNGLVGSRAYTFQVRSRTNASNLSEPVTVTHPDPPTNLKIEYTTPSSVMFVWDFVAGVTGYEVSVNDKVEDITVRYYVVRHLEGQSFTFSVRAKDAAGSVSLENAIYTDREAPSKPSDLRILSSTDDSVTLGWNASTDNVGVAGYRFHFRPDGGSFDIQGTSQTVRGLRTGVVYYFEVRAYDSAENFSDTSFIEVSVGDK